VRKSLASPRNRVFEKQKSVTLDVINDSRYYSIVIKSFADKETENLFKRTPLRKLPGNLQHKARMKLKIIDAAEVIQDLAVPPGNRLEKLTGSRKGQYSIRINDQWRICFVWKNGDAHQVEIVDYHKG
jgi:proteic killer suppression protein